MINEARKRLGMNLDHEVNPEAIIEGLMAMLADVEDKAAMLARLHVNNARMLNGHLDEYHMDKLKAQSECAKQILSQLPKTGGSGIL